MAKEVKQKHGGTLKVLEKGETANPNGRPKKGIYLINKELADKGYAPATRSDIEENYMQLVQLKEEELKKLVNDIKQPMLIRIIVKNMLSPKGFDVIEKMLDRGIGKATQPIVGLIKNDFTNPLEQRLIDLGLN